LGLLCFATGADRQHRIESKGTLARTFSGIERFRHAEDEYNSCEEEGAGDAISASIIPWCWARKIPRFGGPAIESVA